MTVTRTTDVSTDLVDVEDMAQRLGLQVRSSSAYTAMLYDDTHSVYIAAPPTRSVKVDGATIAGAETVSQNGQLYLSRATERAIATQLARTDRRPTVTHQHTPSHTPHRQPATGVVMLDAGHGGKDPGAPNRYGPAEKHIALDTTLRVQRILAANGIKTLMTRTGDSYPTLDQRIAYANQTRPNLYVSIHADSAPNESAQGFTIYVARKASSRSIEAAKALIDAMKRTHVRSRGMRRADFKVIAKTSSPAVLVELGYLSNATEARRLSTAQHRQRMAEAVAAGILDALRGRP